MKISALLFQGLATPKDFMSPFERAQAQYAGSPVAVQTTLSAGRYFDGIQHSQLPLVDAQGAYGSNIYLRFEDGHSIAISCGSREVSTPPGSFIGVLRSELFQPLDQTPHVLRIGDLFPNAFERTIWGEKPRCVGGRISEILTLLRPDMKANPRATLSEVTVVEMGIPTTDLFAQHNSQDPYVEFADRDPPLF